MPAPSLSPAECSGSGGGKEISGDAFKIQHVDDTEELFLKSQT